MPRSRQDKIQVGVLFTTDGVIVGKGWVLLEDDKKLQSADNVTPMSADEIIAAYGKEMTDLVDARERQADDRGSSPTSTSRPASTSRIPTTSRRRGCSRTTSFRRRSRPPRPARRSSWAPANFGESETLANIYANMLEANGYPVSKKLKIGSREIYFPALKNGADLVPARVRGIAAHLPRPEEARDADAADNATRLAAAA